jgi:cell division septal protein FtsQ
MKNRVLSSPRLDELRRKRKKLFWRKVFILVSLFILVFVGLVYGSRNQKINITSIEVAGNKIIDTEIIKNIATEKMTGNYLYFFPKTNFLLYPNRGIKNTLSTEYRRFKNVSIKLENLTTILITVDEREAKYTWCGGEMPNNDDNIKCYFLDRDGYIFDESPYFSQDVYVRFYGKNGVNIDNPIGSSFAPNIFEQLAIFEDSIKKMNLRPKAFLLSEDGDVKMFLPKKETMTTTPEVIFKAEANFEKVAENLQSALTTEPLQTEFRDKYISLLYIDLRFDNKVYYKFK